MQRIAVGRLLEKLCRSPGTAKRQIEGATGDEHGRIARILGDRKAKLPVRAPPVPLVVHVHEAKRHVRTRALRIDGECAMRGVARLRRRLGVRQDAGAAGLAVSQGNAAPGRLVFRIKAKRRLEMAKRLFGAVAGMQLAEESPLQVLVVGLGIGCGRRLGHALVEQRDLQRTDDGTGDVVLNLEDVVDLAVVGLGPDVEAVVGTDELRRYAQDVAGLAHAAFEYVGDAERLGDIGDGDLLALEEKR